MEHNHHKSIKEAVLSKIQSGQMNSRPRLYFAMRFAALVCIALLALLVSAFIFNFMLFRIALEGEAPLIAFGPRGFFIFLYFIPWLLVAIDALLIIILNKLLRTFRFGYRSPAIFLLGGLLAVALGLAFFMYRATDIDMMLAHHAHRGEFPEPFGSFFDPHHRIPPPPGGVIRGTVTSVSDDSFTLLNTEFGTSTVFTVTRLDDAGPFPGLQVGDQVIVAGRPDGSTTIRAFGVQELPPPPVSS